MIDLNLTMVIPFLTGVRYLIAIVSIRFTIDVRTRTLNIFKDDIFQ